MIRISKFNSVTLAMLIVLGCCVMLPVGRANDGIERSVEKRSDRFDISRIDRAKIQSISDRIDQHVSAQLQSNNEKHNPPASDEIFLRRVYLDIAGRIPTIEEAQTFLGSSDKNKRARLVDQLLDSYGYVSRQFNFLADLLRVQSRVRKVVGQPYIDFIKDSLEENKPYDQFVRELLASSGPMMQEGNGAVGYYLRDIGMPEDNMSNTVRIFLGTRLECAQCHDHPFDKWTQREYFEMVAFTGGMAYRTRVPDSEFGREIMELRRDRTIDPNLKPILRRLVDPMTLSVRGSGTGLARLPEGFMGEAGEEFDIVKAKTMFGEKSPLKPVIPMSRRSRRVGKNVQQIRGAPEIESREAYAQWMTSPENPRFAKVIANRLWKHAFGLGLIEPVDVIEENTVASNPQLMDFLTEAMIELEFDMKQFLRAVYNTRTYQSVATGHDINEPAKYNFKGPVVRRMSAEQIWDSLLTMAVPEVDQRHSAARQGRRNYMVEGDLYDRYEKLRGMTPDELIELAEQRKTGRRPPAMTDEMNREIEERRIQAREKRQDFAQKMRRARRAGDLDRVEELLLMRQEHVLQFQKNSGKGRSLRRASELTSPAPVGHFLREFGQSDREEIQNANEDPAVTQVLSLMNGFIEDQIASNPNTVLMRNLMRAKKSERLDTVYLTMLGRKATPRERKIWYRESEESENYSEVISDLIWVLANSNEFIFVK